MPLPVAVFRTVAGISLVVNAFVPLSPATVVKEILPPVAPPAPDADAIGITFKLDSGLRFIPCIPCEKNNWPPFPCTANMTLFPDVEVAPEAAVVLVVLVELVICLLASSTFLAMRRVCVPPAPMTNVLGVVAIDPEEVVVAALLLVEASLRSWLPIITVCMGAPPAARVGI